MKRFLSIAILTSMTFVPESMFAATRRHYRHHSYATRHYYATRHAKRKTALRVGGGAAGGAVVGGLLGGGKGAAIGALAGGAGGYAYDRHKKHHRK